MESPFDEVLRRYADQAPAWLITRLAALQNLRGLWAESAVKRADDHRREKKLIDDMAGAGGEGAAPPTGEDEMLGDFRIGIQGDTYNIVSPSEPKPAAAKPEEKPVSPVVTPAPSPPTTTTTTTTKRTVLREGLRRFVIPALIGGGLVGGGVAGTMLYSWLTNRPVNSKTIEKPDNRFDYRYGIKVHNGPP